MGRRAGVHLDPVVVGGTAVVTAFLGAGDRGRADGQPGGAGVLPRAPRGRAGGSEVRGGGCGCGNGG